MAISNQYDITGKPLLIKAMAEAALEYTQKIEPMLSANKVGEMLMTVGGAFLCLVTQRGTAMSEADAIEDLTVERGIEIMAENAKRFHCGNCMEHAAVAFIWLRDQGVRPIDYVSRSTVDHALVVIGRTRDAPLNNPRKWGDAYICDPWDEDFYPARLWIQKMVGSPAFDAVLEHRMEQEG